MQTPDLDPGALEAAARAMHSDGWTCDTHEPGPWGECQSRTGNLTTSLGIAITAYLATLPSLTAEDVPHVAWRAWEEGRAMGLLDHTGSIMAGRSIRTPNPYAEEADHE